MGSSSGGDAEWVYPTGRVREALREHADIRIDEAERSAERARSEAEQQRVSSGLYRTTVSAAQEAEIARARERSVADIEAEYEAAALGGTPVMQQQPDYLGQAMSMGGQVVGTALSGVGKGSGAAAGAEAGAGAGSGAGAGAGGGFASSLVSGAGVAASPIAGHYAGQAAGGGGAGAAAGGAAGAAAGYAGGVISGAMSGASWGSAIMPGWGTVIGGVLGAASGYFAQ